MSRSVRFELLAMVGAFVLGTLVAEAFGAHNTGIALGVGQICFAITAVAVIVRPKL
jgi:hypothetical protein